MVSISINKVRHLLLNNNYPRSVVDKCQKVTVDRVKNNLRNNAGLRGWSFCRFPFIKGLSPRIGFLFRPTNCKLVFYNVFKVKDLYSRLKDPVDKMDRSFVVYKIPCTCGKVYIGQTKQKLKKRLYQHSVDCRPESLLKPNRTALADHHFDREHNFQFDATEILDYETHYFKRNVSEMFFIKVFDCVNYRSDTLSLSSSYCDIIESVKCLFR
ncbi:uncharacterized protein LOC123270061 [Cotesia glomerata]|nr:uncharacterized protein LOC123270061 [Cotesia glomerata]